MPTNQVSIHTPTQGVTLRKYVGDQLIQVSIHTPTQGVTAITAYFTLTKSVSIHTPTQGVTPAHGIYHWQTQSFNPHTHAGCDPISNNIL